MTYTLEYRHKEDAIKEQVRLKHHGIKSYIRAAPGGVKKYGYFLYVQASPFGQYFKD